jgi:hypothetical protein
MSLDNPTDRKDQAEQRQTQFVMAMSYLLAAAAILNVAMAFLHRQSIVAEWQDLQRRSYPPYEAYETIGIDMNAGLGFLALTCAWAIFQLSSIVLYLCACRKIGMGANLAFGVLWLLSLAGAVFYHLVIRTIGWGTDDL